jgi:drug/metabolite transporter (DMT)-like permease
MPGTMKVTYTPVQSPAAVLPPRKSFKKSSVIGLCYVALSAFTFSVMSMLIKVASTDTDQSPGLSALSICFYRSAISFFCNFAWSILFVKIESTVLVGLRLTLSQRYALAGRCFTGTISLIAGFTAFTHLPLEDASTLIFTAPLVTFGVARVVLKEDVSLVDFFCAIACLLGVICVSSNQALHNNPLNNATLNNVTVNNVTLNVNATSAFTQTTSNPQRTIGIIVALTAACASGCAYVFVRKLSDVDPETVVGTFMAFAGVVSAFLAFLTSSFSLPHDAVQTWSCIGIGVSGFVGQQLLTRGLAIEKAGPAAVMRYLDVLFAFLWSAFFLHATINPWSVVGAVVIMCSAVTVTVNRAARSGNEPVVIEVERNFPLSSVEDFVE